ncbi:unnamed protein product [Phytophthora lilii]|uniref:Unnamed protein product n=1 Tax=Phytophthora lilii TaxID=2077276 RepID=A0A9W6X6J9_9STRA|nr:unnamed protein product [Phytophthora lilii]
MKPLTQRSDATKSTLSKRQSAVSCTELSACRAAPSKPSSFVTDGLSTGQDNTCVEIHRGRLTSASSQPCHHSSKLLLDHNGSCDSFRLRVRNHNIIIRCVIVTGERRPTTTESRRSGSNSDGGRTGLDPGSSGLKPGRRLLRTISSQRASLSRVKVSSMTPVVLGLTASVQLAEGASSVIPMDDESWAATTVSLGEDTDNLDNTADAG